MGEKLPHTLGRYEVVAAIGHGGMGALYRARDPRIGRDVAIKLLREGFDGTELRNRFAREARSAGSLSHPNIVTIYDIGIHEGRPFIAMEYVPGETFASLIKAKAPLPLARKLQMIEEVCAGLAHAHAAGVVHRDIKPANLMVGREGTIKVLDFGIAKLLAAGITQPGVMMGTLSYMCPEQIKGGAVDHRADIFAVGAVLYELLSFHQAFPGKVRDTVIQQILGGAPVPLAEHCPDIDPRLVRIIERALQKDPGRRFQTAEALQQELTAVRLGAPANASTAARPPRPRTDRATLATLRAEQITSRLADVERAVDAGDYDRAIECCEQVLLLDPADPRATAQLDRIHDAIDARQVRTWLAESRQHLARGAIAAASDRLEEASLIAPSHPDVVALGAEIEKEKARLRGDAGRAAHARARGAFASGDFAAALGYANQALTLDPAGADIRASKAEIEQAAAATAEEARVRALVDEARRRFLKGEHDAAWHQLEQEGTSNPLVVNARGELQRTRQAIEQRRAEQDRLERQQRAAALMVDARAALQEQRHDAALTALFLARHLNPTIPGLADLTESVRREREGAVRDRPVAELTLRRKAAAGPGIPVIDDRPLDLGPRHEALTPGTPGTPAAPIPTDDSTGKAATKGRLHQPLAMAGAALIVAAILAVRFWPTAPPPVAPSPVVTVPHAASRPPAPPPPASPTFALTIAGAYPFEVEFAGAKRAPSTNHSIQLPAGATTQVRLRSRDVFLDRSMPVQGDAGQTRTLQAPPLSSVTVYNAWDESCGILIDGRFAGWHPLMKALVSGPHEISLKCADGRAPKPQHVQVPATVPGLVKFTKAD